MPDRNLEMGMENEGYDDSDRDSDEERKGSQESRRPQRDGDFMEANPRQLQKNRMASEKSDSDISTGRDGERKQLIDDMDDEDNDSRDSRGHRERSPINERSNERPKFASKPTSLNDKNIITKKKIISRKSSNERNKREQTSSERRAENKQKARDEIFKNDNKQAEDC
jgi:hypothetical protein